MSTCLYFNAACLQLRNHSEKIARAHIEVTFPHFVDEIPSGRSPILKQGNKIVSRCKNNRHKQRGPQLKGPAAPWPFRTALPCDFGPPVFFFWYCGTCASHEL